MQITTDQWLANQMKSPVWVVRFEQDESAPAVHRAVDTALHATVGTAFFHVKVPSDRLDLSAALTTAGFLVVDVNVTFGRSPGLDSDGGEGQIGGVEVRPVEHREGQAVIDLATRCFDRSRFHMDPLIPTESADRINGAWVADYVEGRRGEILDGAFVDGELAGFNAILKDPAPDGDVLVIDLIGVDARFRGRGVGRALVSQFLHWSAGQCREVRVGTQAANLPAVRLYESFGFRLSDVRYVLHAHVENGTVRSWF